MKRWLVIAAFGALGCSRAVTPPLTITQASDLPKLRTIVVASVAARATSGDAAERAPGAVTAMLAAAAKQAPVWTVVDVAKVEAAEKSLASSADPESRAGATAAKVGADAALGAIVRRYEERKGSDYGASDGASVSLVVMLVPAGAKQAVWKADYTVHQVPLTYNLWNFWEFQRGGIRWQTVDQLTSIGIEEAVKRLAANLPPR